MSQITERELKEYFKQIKLLLPIYTKEEKRFISDLRAAVDEYLEQNPNCTAEEFWDHFDEPAEAVYNYLSSLEQVNLCKKVKIRKYLIKLIIVIAIISIFSLNLRIYWDYLIYKRANESMITEIETVIE